jgi:hypothetical protein
MKRKINYKDTRNYIILHDLVCQKLLYYMFKPRKIATAF